MATNVSPPSPSHVGRDELVTSARQHIERVLSGASPATVLLVTGEAGIGKSTLLRTLREECERAVPGVTVAAAECSTPLAGQSVGEIEALEPWAQIIAQLADPTRPDTHTTRKLVGQLAMAWVRVIPVVGDVLESTIDSARIVQSHIKGGAPRGQQGAASQQQMFQQSINLLGELASRGPLLLMIDDMHWADPSSCDLLFAAARQLAGRPVAFVVAYRPDDVASGRDGDHPIAHVRNELERYSMVWEVGVPRLMADDLDLLLRQRYPEYRNDDAFEEWIARVSSGNALFVTQYLTMLEDDGVIDRSTGEVRGNYHEMRPPSSAQAVVAERIRRMDEETRELLRYASVEGDTFTSLVLARTVELPALKLLQRLRLIEESHRVVKSLGKQRLYATESTAWQFAHALLHKAMYESLMEEERELLHEAVFAVLREQWEAASEAGTNLEGVAARLAVHAGILGEYRFAAEALLEGARSTWREYAARETRTLLQQASEALDAAVARDPREEPKVHGLRGEISFLHGDMHHTHSEFSQAAVAFGEAQRAFEAAGMESRAVDALARRSAALEMSELRDEARELALEARRRGAAVGNDAGTFDAIVTLARLASNGNDALGGAALLEEALAMAERMNDSHRLVLALDSLGILRERLGDVDAGVAAYRRSLDVALSTHDVASEALARNSLGCVYLVTDELETAIEHFTRGLEIARAMGDRDGEARILNNLAMSNWGLERADEALAQFHRSLKIYRAIGSAYGEGLLLGNIADSLSEQDRLDEALPVFKEALVAMESVGYDRTLSNLYNGAGVVSRKLGFVDEAIDYHRKGIEAARRAQSVDNEGRNLGNLGVALAELAATRDGAERQALTAESRTAFETCLAVLGPDHVSYEYWKERRGESGVE